MANRQLVSIKRNAENLGRKIIIRLVMPLAQTEYLFSLPVRITTDTDRRKAWQKNLGQKNSQLTANVVRPFFAPDFFA
jgi:hypothetical protein